MSEVERCLSDQHEVNGSMLSRSASLAGALGRFATPLTSILLLSPFCLCLQMPDAKYLSQLRIQHGIEGDIVGAGYSSFG